MAILSESFSNDPATQVDQMNKLIRELQEEHNIQVSCYYYPHDETPYIDNNEIRRMKNEELDRLLDEDLTMRDINPEFISERI